MKAMTLQAANRLLLTDRGDPGAPAPGEVRVHVEGSSLNYHDLAVFTGALEVPTGRILLSDCGGVIEAVGAGVSEFQPGDRVVSCFFPDWQDGRPRSEWLSHVPGDSIDGFAQEYVIRPATAFTRAPSGYDPVESATLTTAGLTAWRALVVDGQLKAGETVLLLGTGGVSVFGLQIARSMGARVAMVSSSDEKLERCRGMGAEFLLNYRSTPA